jgi:hypothetical protein
MKPLVNIDMNSVLSEWSSWIRKPYQRLLNFSNLKFTFKLNVEKWSGAPHHPNTISQPIFATSLQS